MEKKELLVWSSIIYITLILLVVCFDFESFSEWSLLIFFLLLPISFGSVYFFSEFLKPHKNEIEEFGHWFGKAIELFFGLIIVGLILWFGYKTVVWGYDRTLGKIGKYEGLTAEEWEDEANYWLVMYEDLEWEHTNLQEQYGELEDEYDTFKSCVEDYSYESVVNQIYYGGAFYYCD